MRRLRVAVGSMPALVRVGRSLTLQWLVLVCGESAGVGSGVQKIKLDVVGVGK